MNTNIALQDTSLQLENPINAFAKVLQVRGAQQENQLNQMKMDEYGRGVQRTNALQSLLSGEYDTPEARQSAMIKGGFLKEASDYGKSNSDAADAASKRKTEELTQANKRIDLAGSAFGFVRQNPTPENAFAALDHLASNGIYSPEQVAEYKAKIQANPQAVAQMADLAFRGALSAKEQLAKMGEFNGGGAQQFTSTDPVSGKVTNTGSIAITESENNKANNLTSRQNNAATVAASLANAGATREVASATRDAAKITRDGETERKMADDYRSQSKGFGEASSAYKQINATLDSATKSPAATLAAATKFMKILDPGSVVRESELGMALQASGVLDRAANYMNILQRGKVLTATQVADFKDISQKMYSAAQQVQKTIDQDYQGKAKAYGLRPEMVTQNLGQNDSAPKTVVQTGTTKDGRKVVKYSDGTVDYAN